MGNETSKRWSKWAGLGLAAVLAAGCGTPATALRVRSADAIDCHPFVVDVERTDDGNQHVEGCSRRVVYDWVCEVDDCAWRPVEG